MLGSHGGAKRINRTHDSNPPTAEDHATANRTGPDRDSDVGVNPLAPRHGVEAQGMQPPEAAAARRLRAPAPPEATVALALTSRKARDPN